MNLPPITNKFPAPLFIRKSTKHSIFLCLTIKPIESSPKYVYPTNREADPILSDSTIISISEELTRIRNIQYEMESQIAFLEYQHDVDTLRTNREYATLRAFWVSRQQYINTLVDSLRNLRRT